MSEEDLENLSAEDVPVASLARRQPPPPPKPVKRKENRNDNAVTPQWIMNYVMEEFGCDFDPCPVGYEDGGVPDGLAMEWPGVAFVNPPQASCQAWVQKAVEQQSHQHYSILLVPFNAKSLYWREIVYPNATEIRIFKCPIRFDGHDKQQVTEMCLLRFAAEHGPNGGEPLLSLIEPEGWQEGYYKRQRNALRFQTRR